jgi:transcriptional regulator with XRE-family HTH domain
LPRKPEKDIAEVLDLARESLKRRLESANEAERTAWRQMALHQRLDFVLDWLRAWSKHFSMSRLAGRVGVSRQAISKIRKGEVVPTTKLLVPLARELGVSHRFLTEGLLDYPQLDQSQAFFGDLPHELVRWLLEESPGRREYVHAALELARAAESGNVDLRFFQQLLRLAKPG